MANNETYEEKSVALRMLKLTDTAVANAWPSLRSKIEMSLPPLSVPSEKADRMTRVLEGLMSGIFECVVFFKSIEGVVFVYGFAILARVRNLEGSGEHLLIYAAYGHTKFILGEGLPACLALVKEYARGQGCSAIMAYSSLPNVIKTVKDAGGSADFRLLMLEV